MTIVVLTNAGELAKKCSAWYECHWTFASTEAGAQAYFEKHGLKTEGVTVYKIPFGYCYPVKGGAA